MDSELLSELGRRVRALREQRGWSRRRLGKEAEVSERFLSQVEGGSGNVSLLRLAQIADALDSTPAALLSGIGGPAPLAHIHALLGGLDDDGLRAAEALLRARFAPHRTGFVALLGLRGAGKSTVGPMLANELGRAFVELDDLAERAAGLSVGEIFALHGEDYYRRLERDALARHLAQSAPCIIATGGGIVADPATFELLRRNTTTVWLRATPERHWQRVVAQGDTRPMADNPQPMAELRRLLAAREPLYSQADVMVDTTELTPAQVCDRVAAALA